MILKEGLTIFFGREDLNLAWVALVKPNHTSFWALLIIYLILKVEYLVYCEVTYCSNKQEHMWWKYCKHSKCFYIWHHIDLHKYFQDLARGKKEFRGIFCLCHYLTNILQSNCHQSKLDCQLTILRLFVICGHAK